jgi:hypothetical protein
MFPKIVHNRRDVTRCDLRLQNVRINAASGGKNARLRWRLSSKHEDGTAGDTSLSGTSLSTRHDPGAQVAHYFVGALSDDGGARHTEGVALHQQTPAHIDPILTLQFSNLWREN